MRALCGRKRVLDGGVADPATAAEVSRQARRVQRPTPAQPLQQTAPVRLDKITKTLGGPLLRGSFGGRGRMSDGERG